MGALFVRMTIALDAITAGDQSAAKAWLWNRNSVLDGSPISLIQTASGLAAVVAYLEVGPA